MGFFFTGSKSFERLIISDWKSLPLEHLFSTNTRISQIYHLKQVVEWYLTYSIGKDIVTLRLVDEMYHDICSIVARASDSSSRFYSIAEQEGLTLEHDENSSIRGKGLHFEFLFTIKSSEFPPQRVFHLLPVFMNFNKSSKNGLYRLQKSLLDYLMYTPDYEITETDLKKSDYKIPLKEVIMKKFQIGEKESSLMNV